MMAQKVEEEILNHPERLHNKIQDPFVFLSHSRVGLKLNKSILSNLS